jgi:hypothetical protein
MHGGPPTVLAGRYLAEHGGGDAFHLARLTVELVRPVPLVPLTVEVRETRPGRRIQLLDLVLRDEQDTELVYARGMRIARGDNGLDESLLDMPGPVAVAGPDDSSPYEHGYPLPACGFYMDAFDIRSVDGRSFGAVGPSASWFRLLAPVFAGEPITPLDRVLAVADFGNGISNIIEMGRHVYINPDRKRPPPATRRVAAERCRHPPASRRLRHRHRNACRCQRPARDRQPVATRGARVVTNSRDR